MAAPCAQISTPLKTYVLGNICVMCGFSFVQKVRDEENNEIVLKYTDRKLKLSDDRLANITNVVGFPIKTDKDTGVCQKCYRAVEKVLKSEKEMSETKDKLSKSTKRVQDTLLLCLPSPRRKTVNKRVIVCSPDAKPVMKKTQTQILPINIIKPVTIMPFSDITAKINANREPPSIPVPTIRVKSEVNKLKPARRSLGSSFMQLQSPSDPPPIVQGEVEISISYPSGKRTVLVTNPSYKSICKAISKSENVEKAILDVLVESNPNDVVTAASKVVSLESKELCKRNSGSLLQSKDHDSLMTFTWDKFHSELQIRAPNVLKIISAIITDIPVAPTSKKFMHIMHTIAYGYHSRNQEMSALQYCISFILLHGGCTQRDIQRLSKLGLSVSPGSVYNKLASWIDKLDDEVKKLKKDLEEGGDSRYQLVGDNWDKNILPAFRTSQQKTISLHLFNAVVVADRIKPTNCNSTRTPNDHDDDPKPEIDVENFIPSILEQEILKNELVFLFATSLIQHIPKLTQEFAKIYPEHLIHKHSTQAGIKTKQYPLGLFDTNETKTAEVIKLLRDMQSKYVPSNDGVISESVFFGGDRLTDERVQCAQKSVFNGDSAASRLEGFISKIEDFHRLMNFLEAICRLTYNTDSIGDRGTASYFRNLLDARNVKGEVRNAYRANKLLYYTLLDAMCCVLFLKKYNLDLEDNIPLPDNFGEFSDIQKITWLNEICKDILEEYFFENGDDIMKELRKIITDDSHPENYYLSKLNDGKVQCHFCDKSYACVDSLKAHEEKKHNAKPPPTKVVTKNISDEVGGYCRLLFKLTLLHKNLDTAVDMGDGYRSVRSAKYELPIYVKTGKTKYAIGSVHLTALTEEILKDDQKERLIVNRCVNLQGGRNNNLALDEYVELLNRDSKITCTGFQTKESILRHSKEFPHIINFVKNFDAFCSITSRKGFHHLPSYTLDVGKVIKELQDINAFNHVDDRKLKCRKLCTNKNIFDDCFRGFGTCVHRHKPVAAFHRLRNKHV